MHRDTLSRHTKPPQDNIPQTAQQRERLLRTAADCVRAQKLVAPLSLDELKTHSLAVLRTAGEGQKYLDFTAILVNNELWRPTLAAIPCEKRLLLLPKCLRDLANCPAKFDRIGLLCQNCGSCPIGEIKFEAERLGYVVLVAEGSPIVMSLVQTGKIQAIVGVSCMSVLENVFPYMESAAIPALAIPLLYDGCAETAVDLDWVWDALYTGDKNPSGWLNLEDLRAEVSQWFTVESLSEIPGPPHDRTETIALEWLARAGKRWRPFLAACVHQALANDKSAHLPEDLRRVAIAVECFHKASLIHDDIEDGDATRYGRNSLHTDYGVPIALNVGDFLLGEGYHLLSQTSASAECKARMLRIASAGHKQLSLGQGAELSWLRNPSPLSVEEVLDIFAKKTSPAFSVALNLGAVLAGAKPDVAAALDRYSDVLGIAYQIRDDINDLLSTIDPADLNAARPSLLLALAYERASNADRKTIASIYAKDAHKSAVQKIISSLNVERIALEMMRDYKSRAVDALAALDNTALKSLLRRVMYKIFDDAEVMGCCNDLNPGHD